MVIDPNLREKIMSSAAKSVPAVIPFLSAKALASIKAGDSLSGINATYHDAITEALTEYFNGGNSTGPRNFFRRATVVALGDAFDAGWADGGQDLPADGDALDWLNARVEEEMGFIDTLFQQAKELKDKGEDYFLWITARADAYMNAVREAYNTAVMFASKNQMLTFAGDDGAESCLTCKKLKGQRHKASWWISHGLVPGPGNENFICKGYNCQHGFQDDEGNWVTL